MKRVRCPKCDNYITFDETQYAEGQAIVFNCEQCGKRFGIRMKTAQKAPPSCVPSVASDQRSSAASEGATIDPTLNGKTIEAPSGAVGGALTSGGVGRASGTSGALESFGSLLVIENVFHYKQELPLHMGDNTIGRYQKGNPITTPIETDDPSIDLLHCIVNVSLDKHGHLRYILRDANSNTGTFVDNTEIPPRERRVITDGTLFTIGATSIILHATPLVHAI